MNTQEISQEFKVLSKGAVSSFGVHDKMPLLENMNTQRILPHRNMQKNDKH